MSYVALYRKYRPKMFKEISGQEHIVKTLTNQIMTKRIAHAYLFCGTRGTGKTSIAKIFSKAVNCENPQDGEACGVCDTCEKMRYNNDINIIEIDAASNNGVDNIREINNEVKYPPTNGRYKVYIIDEVHMLSTSAFNALLKTLEEPPKHIIFILATTEPQKILATILSRCQRFDFKRISTNDIFNRLSEYLKIENIDIEKDALNYIAKISDGGMRDAWSILDQISAFNYKEKITLEKVLNILGNVDNDSFIELSNALKEKDFYKCIQIVDSIYINGKDIKQFISDAVQFFRNLLMICSMQKFNTQSDNIANILEVTEETAEILKNQANLFSSETLMKYIKAFSELENKIKYEDQKKILLEILLIELCDMKQNIVDNSLENRVEQLESQIKNGIAISQNIVKDEKSKTQKIIEKKKVPLAIPEDVKNDLKLWNEIKEQFKSPRKAMMLDTEARSLNDACYYIICPNEAIKMYLEKHRVTVEEKLESMAQKKYQIKPILAEEFEMKYNETCERQSNNLENDEYQDEVIKNVVENFSKAGVKIEEVYE